MLYFIAKKRTFSQKNRIFLKSQLTKFLQRPCREYEVVVVVVVRYPLLRVPICSCKGVKPHLEKIPCQRHDIGGGASPSPARILVVVVVVVVVVGSSSSR